MGPAPGNVEVLQWLATLGVGGVLAAFIFIFYRKDLKQSSDLWKGQADVLISVVKENTASNTKLITVIEALNLRVTREWPPRTDGGH